MRPNGAEQVRIREVGPRDGFQNEPEIISTENKIRLIHALLRAGLRRLEVASFVRADVIPQLADGVEVLERIDVPAGVDLTVLVPNSRGLAHALKAREHFQEVVIFVSASETHNRKNVNRTVAETMGDNRAMVKTILREGLACEAVVATSFGCPYEGRVALERVVSLAEQFAEWGVSEIGFGDTTGMASPRSAGALFAEARERLAGLELTAHFHNTRGQGLANAYAAYEAGCRSFESSFGELGGCPVPSGSTGNVATEDLVCMFHEMGADTGIDLLALIEAAREAQEVLGRTLTSHTIVAGPPDWEPSRPRPQQ
jgi:hydroxymethylglutaryl-CoA lyase